MLHPSHNERICTATMKRYTAQTSTTECCQVQNTMTAAPNRHSCSLHVLVSLQQTPMATAMNQQLCIKPEVASSFLIYHKSMLAMLLSNSTLFTPNIALSHATRVIFIGTSVVRQELFCFAAMLAAFIKIALRTLPP